MASTSRLEAIEALSSTLNTAAALSFSSRLARWTSKVSSWASAWRSLLWHSRSSPCSSPQRLVRSFSVRASASLACCSRSTCPVSTLQSLRAACISSPSCKFADFSPSISKFATRSPLLVASKWAIVAPSFFLVLREQPLGVLEVRLRRRERVGERRDLVLLHEDRALTGRHLGAELARGGGKLRGDLREVLIARGHGLVQLGDLGAQRGVPRVRTLPLALLLDVERLHLVLEHGQRLLEVGRVEHLLALLRDRLGQLGLQLLELPAQRGGHGLGVGQAHGGPAQLAVGGREELDVLALALHAVLLGELGAPERLVGELDAVERVAQFLPDGEDAHLHVARLRAHLAVLRLHLGHKLLLALDLRVRDGDLALEVDDLGLGLRQVAVEVLHVAHALGDLDVARLGEGALGLGLLAALHLVEEERLALGLARLRHLAQLLLHHAPLLRLPRLLGHLAREALRALERQRRLRHLLHHGLHLILEAVLVGRERRHGALGAPPLVHLPLEVHLQLLAEALE
mmetsp:Transcript_49399/g.117376  ORF Transcript_49399/g.117376 Transcript_49399/m.117376 type:complete len:516 (-) Transcript_49399:593-2140(-)